MKVKKNAIVSIIVIFIYVMTTAFVSISLIAEYSNGNKRSEKKFNSIERGLSIYLRNNELYTETFYQDIDKIIGDKADISRLQIVYNGIPVYSFPLNINTDNGVSSSLLRQISTTIETPEGGSMLISAEMYKLKPYSIFTLCRTAFIIILATTLCLILYILFFADKDASLDADESEAEDKEEYSEDLTILDTDADFNTDGEENIASQNGFSITEEEAKALLADSPSEDEEEVKEVDDTTFAKEDASTEENAVSEKTAGFAEETFSSESESSKEAPVSDENAVSLESGELEPVEDDSVQPKTPQNDYRNETTGFCTSAYMQHRIDNELVRAASCEQELALFTIRIVDIDWNTACGKELSSMLLDVVKFNDSIFDYKDDGCVAVFQNQNTDIAIKTADVIKDRIKSILEKYGLSNNFGIGISTRSLRLMSFDRLFEESSQALLHALEDRDSPVVAFRVNPEKYRNYLAQTSSK